VADRLTNQVQDAPYANDLVLYRLHHHPPWQPSMHCTHVWHVTHTTHSAICSPAK
jgi:hypothetical protein